MIASLAGRLDRMERRMEPLDHKLVEKASGGVPLRTLIAGLMKAVDEDAVEAAARAKFAVSEDAEPTVEQLADAQAELAEAGASPVAHNPELCDALLAIRKQQDQTIDTVTLDSIIKSGAAPQHHIDYENTLVQSFQTFIETHLDEIDALQILYATPYGKRLTRDQIKALADAIQLPPRQWTPEALWAAYQQLDASRVKGASVGRMWTDIVALARRALHPEVDLVPFADEVKERFAVWLAQQANTGRTFTPEQMRWLEMIRDRVAGDAEVRIEDFDDVPFVQEGGLGRLHEVFGEEYEVIVAELNERLVA